MLSDCPHTVSAYAWMKFVQKKLDIISAKKMRTIFLEKNCLGAWTKGDKTKSKKKGNFFIKKHTLSGCE